MILVLHTSLNRYMSMFPLMHFAVLVIPACSKSINANARLVAFALSLMLDPLFGIHSHKTSGCAQP